MGDAEVRRGTLAVGFPQSSRKLLSDARVRSVERNSVSGEWEV
jgi:hypothetical protein